MRHSWFAAPLVCAIGLTALLSFRPHPSPAQPPAPAAKPTPPLPLTHVVLFSSGVGYFQREGEVEGNARVELTFPATDVNDLLKSLVLHDAGGGKVAAINYDSQDPVERTLRTFALDLTANPSLGQLLNMARGEKVEVTLQSTGAGAAGTLNGSILGMESQIQAHGTDKTLDIDVLNLLTTDGLRSVPLTQVLRVRFLNPTVEAELKRALDAIAGARDAQKKSVALSFRGDGKRAVRVGYVVESPVWKTTYRLVLNGNGQAGLQGWGVVENTTDNDWANVKLALVSGRPISYQMDLYPPLYVPRPTVELERFASLRPPNYGGAMTNPGPGVGGIGGTGGVGGSIAGGGATGAQFQGMHGFAGGNNLANQGFAGGNNRYQGGQWGQQGGPRLNNNNINVAEDTGDAMPPGNRITFEELQRRRKEKEDARKAGNKIAGNDPIEGVATDTEEAGDVVQYVIDERVTLPRQKSAMLPVIDQKVTCTKLSVFNETIHAKFPLLSLRFKNDAKVPLMQGPVTVYEGTAYAGDTRFPDLQPGEERLVSFALDSGMEVKTEGGTTTQQLHTLHAVKGVLYSTTKVRQPRRYLIKNRSPQERALVIEHPIREGWTLVTPDKPAERSRDVYRFLVTVPAGAAQTFAVVEEMRRHESVQLASAAEDDLKIVLRGTVASPKMKAALEELTPRKRKLTDATREAAQVGEQLKAIVEDQARLRANFEKVPPTSDAYKRYLTKFDAQETEIEKLQTDLKAKQAAEKARRTEYEAFLAGLTVDG